MAKELAFAFKVCGFTARRLPADGTKACRKRTAQRLLALIDDNADLQLIRANCRKCGACRLGAD